jgi:hypothetical protein
MAVRTRSSMHDLSASSSPVQPSLPCPAEAQQSVIKKLVNNQSIDVQKCPKAKKDVLSIEDMIVAQTFCCC